VAVAQAVGMEVVRGAEESQGVEGVSERTAVQVWAAAQALPMTRERSPKLDLRSARSSTGRAFSVTTTIGTAVASFFPRALLGSRSATVTSWLMAASVFRATERKARKRSAMGNA
jgi:hypothetical protein